MKIIKFAVSIGLLLSLLQLTEGVDRSKFRTCKDTGFCRRFRDLSSGPVFDDHYSVEASSIQLEGGRFTATVATPQGRKENNVLRLAVSHYESGSIRVKLSEDTPRWQPSELLLDDGSRLAGFELLDSLDARLPRALKEGSGGAAEFTALLLKGSPSNAGVVVGAGWVEADSVLVVHSAPFRLELFRGGVLQISANERSLLHFEPDQHTHGRRAAEAGEKMEQEGEEEEEGEDEEELTDEERHGGKEVVDYGEDGLAIYADGTKEERRVLSSAADRRKSKGAGHSAAHGGDSFGGHHDSMPRGARSVGLDVSFPFSTHVYGIPEHTTGLSLPTTSKGSPAAPRAPEHGEPFRLYSLDVFEYEIGQTMALYGHIPVLFAHGVVDAVVDRSGQAHRESLTTGVFFFNPSEAFVDISDAVLAGGEGQYKQSRWLFESGELDLFLLPGPSPAAIYRQYSALVGTQQLPPMFALGYHQCRWNYRDERDVAAVEAKFEELDYPMDVIWLDIEHTDGKRYFTWDKRVFPNPIEMQRNVSRHGRKMVTIVDPHIKRDDAYAVHKEATAKGLYIKNKDGGNFDGWCWPGSSSYLDFTSAEVRQWWAEQFSLDRYIGSTLDLFTWNDMNEPSVFNGPEVSMPKDARNLAGEEHREWHNLYGLYMQWATAMGLSQRSPPSMPHPLRPFVLTRSFWAGSQRFGAMWTGDNSAQWSHLQIAAPMLMSINLAGLSFAGADVGGFFGEPGAELFTRWYQAGAFTPFFRGHAHHDTKRREPWVFGEPYTTILRSAAMQRYSLLPYWYSVFFEAYSTGLPVMRPLFLEFPRDVHTFAQDAQWMVGSSLLVCPVTQAAQTSVQAYLPGPQPWYELESLRKVAASAPEGGAVELQAPLETIPVFIRAGSIVPRKMRLRRSSRLMFYDPFTLVVAPTETSSSSSSPAGTAEGAAGGEARGRLYLDDEATLAHEQSGHFAVREFSFRSDPSSRTAVLSCRAAPVSPAPPASTAGHGSSGSSSRSVAVVAPSGDFTAVNTVERVQVAAQPRAPQKVLLKVETNAETETELVFSHDSSTQVLTIKKPDVPVMADWTITLVY